jgi:hypothetical protein
MITSFRRILAIDSAVGPRFDNRVGQGGKNTTATVGADHPRLILAMTGTIWPADLAPSTESINTGLQPGVWTFEPGKPFKRFPFATGAPFITGLKPGVVNESENEFASTPCSQG